MKGLTKRSGLRLQTRKMEPVGDGYGPKSYTVGGSDEPRKLALAGQAIRFAN
jgi:hypothetical protein